jgi:hypothetical protein
MNNHRTIQIIGWYGVIAIIVGYTAVALDWLPSHSVWYQLLNLTGAVALVIEARSKHDQQPVVLNTLWAIIAVIALARFWLP